MIPDRRRYRILLRIGFNLIALLPPFALCFVAILSVMAYTNDRLMESLRGGWSAAWFLVAWLVAEAVFWVAAACTSGASRRLFKRVTPTADERAKLYRDTTAVMGTSLDGERRLIEGWFIEQDRPAVLEDIGKENLKEWLCWAFFNRDTDSEYSPSEAAELDLYLEKLCRHVRERCPGAIPDGKNPSISCIRLTLDPVRAEHRPLAFYLVVWLLQSLLSLLFRAYGFRYAYQEPEEENPDSVWLGYWHRPSSSRPNQPERSPIVIVHGIGSVLSLTNLVIAISGLARDRHIIVLDLPHISMRLPHPSRFPSPETMTAQVFSIVDELCAPSVPGGGKVVVFGHSFGSVLPVWMVKHAPDRLAGIVLCDPVSVLLQLPDVAYNFLYRHPRTAAEIFFGWISREPGVATTLGRNFHWFENVFLSIEAEADATATAATAAAAPMFFPRDIPTDVFLSGRDCIVPAVEIMKLLEKERRGDNVRVHWMHDLDHGSFLFRPKWLSSVATATIQCDSRRHGRFHDEYSR